MFCKHKTFSTLLIIMNTRNIFTVASFLITFSLALMFVELMPTKMISNFGEGQNDLQAESKIYNFLKKDLQIQKEMADKFGDSTKQDNLVIIKEYYEIREKQDVSALPQDFQFAWEKAILNDVEWINFTYHLRKFNGEGIVKTEAQKEIANAKIEEGKRFDYELRSVARLYGVEFDANGNLVEKK